MKRLHLAAVALVVVACSADPIPPPSPSLPSPVPQASLAPSASPPPVAELVGRIRNKTPSAPCQTLIVDAHGNRWEVWLPKAYRTVFQGDDELIYGPDGALIAASGQILGVDLDDTAELGTFCMAGQPVQATKVVFVTDAAPSDTAPFTAWPCTPAVAAPRYQDTPGTHPPPVYLGGPDGEYVPTIEGSFSWMEATEGGDAMFVLQAYISQGGAPPQSLKSTGVVALTLPEPYRIDWWNITVMPWVAEAWTPSGWPPALEPTATVLHIEASGDPTPAVCFEAPPGEHFLHAAVQFADDRGNSVDIYGRLTVEP
jgi:hypothetical protein